MIEPNPELDLLVNEITELRPLPVVALRVLELAEGDRFSAHELAQTVSADQTLTAKILRLSNSAYYEFPRRITTVRDAVVVLGFRAVRSATLASCVIETLPGGQVLDPVQAWRFSVSVGMLAEVLSRATHEHVDEAFTAGVLHNIGRLAMDQHRPRELRQCIEVAQARGWTIPQAERQVLGYTDAEVGGALALNWNFPPALADAVARYNLDIDALPDPKSLAAFVIRARLFARASGLTDGAELPSIDPPSTEWSVPPLSRSLAQTGGESPALQSASPRSWRAPSRGGSAIGWPRLAPTPQSASIASGSPAAAFSPSMAVRQRLAAARPLARRDSRRHEVA